MISTRCSPPPLRGCGRTWANSLHARRRKFAPPNVCVTVRLARHSVGIPQTLTGTRSGNAVCNRSSIALPPAIHSPHAPAYLRCPAEHILPRTRCQMLRLQTARALRLIICRALCDPPTVILSYGTSIYLIHAPAVLCSRSASSFAGLDTGEPNLTGFVCASRLEIACSFIPAFWPKLRRRVPLLPHLDRVRLEAEDWV